MKSYFKEMYGELGIEIGSLAQTIKQNKYVLWEMLKDREHIHFRGGSRKLERTRLTEELYLKIGQERFEDLKKVRTTYLKWIQKYNKAVERQSGLKQLYREKQREVSFGISCLSKLVYKQAHHQVRFVAWQKKNVLPPQAAVALLGKGFPKQVGITMAGSI